MFMAAIADQASGGRPFSVSAMRCRWLVVALLMPVALRDASAQQHIRGRVLDLASNRPIPAVVLTLHGADSTFVASAVSDAAGRWRLDASRPGAYYIAARRLGYQPWVSSALRLDAGAELESVLHLEALPVTLDPIRSEAAKVRYNLEYNGFFERQRSNFGHFLGPDAIERRQASRITDLLTAIPGVQLVTSGMAGPAQVGLRGSSVTDGILCRPRVFVDGLMYTRGDSRAVRVRASDATEQADLDQRMDQAITLDDIGHPSTIAGIEVYRSATQVPVQFGGTSVETLCGVIVIWTRSGRMPVRER